MKRFAVGLLATLGVMTLLLVGGGAAAVWLLLPGPPAAAGADRARPRPARGVSTRRRPPIRSTCSACTTAPTFTDVILALDQAGRDPRVKGLVAQLSGEGPGLAQTQELRTALAALPGAGQVRLRLCRQLRRVRPRDPRLLSRDRLRADPSAADRLARPDRDPDRDALVARPARQARHPAERRQARPVQERRRDVHRDRADARRAGKPLEALADSLDRQIREGIGSGRALEPARVARLIDDGPYFATEAEAAGLVDRLSYWDEVVEQAREPGRHRPAG